MENEVEDEDSVKGLNKKKFFHYFRAHQMRKNERAQELAKLFVRTEFTSADLFSFLYICRKFKELQGKLKRKKSENNPTLQSTENKRPNQKESPGGLWKILQAKRKEVTQKRRGDPGEDRQVKEIKI